MLLRTLATITAIGREISYPQFSPARLAHWVKIPPLGTIVMLLAYLCFVMALEFVHNDVAGAQHYTALGVRAGWLAVAQLPLLILLIGKNNLIGLATGVSYERLNVLHRWVARMMLLLVTLHFGYQAVGWDEYGLLKLEWATDTCPPTGIAAYAILLWINLSTLAPFRHMAYEIFVVQHIVTFFGFIIAVVIHLPALYARVYVYIPVALYLVDRLVRTLRLVYHNYRPGQAFLEAQAGGVTKIRVRNHRIRRWAPGSHVLLSLPRVGFAQLHPATIASTPTSHGGDLVFLLRSKSGFTRRLLQSAVNAARRATGEEAAVPAATALTALIDGPYPIGGYATAADFAAFDSLLLIAASTGVAFTLPHLLSIAQRASSASSRGQLPLRRVEFVWIVRDRACMSWLDEELSAAHATLVKAGVDVSIRIFVTCADALAGLAAGPLQSSSDPEDDAAAAADGKAFGGQGGEERGGRCCGCTVSPGEACCCSADLEDAIVAQEVDESASSLPEDAEKAEEKRMTTRSQAVEKDEGKEASKPETRMRSVASWSSLCAGRPMLHALVSDLAVQSRGEMSVVVCGPLGLNESVRNTVARISNDRAVHKGTGAQGIYLHVEAFAGL